MFKTDGLGNSKLRLQHKKILFNYIRENEPVSRVQIFRDTAISKPTVTRIIDVLSKDGVVVEDISAGRKPIMLRIKDDAYYAIGIYITRNNIRGVVIDIKNNIITKEKVSVAGLETIDEYLQIITDMISKLVSTVDEKEKILGIGIAAPGLIDYKNGIILDYGGGARYKNINIKQLLESKFDYPIIVDNNANTRVLSEYWNGFGKDFDNIVSVICDIGVGAGIMTDGEVLRGNSNITGEIGHMTVEIEGRLCPCGKRGCVEAYGSTYSIEKQMEEVKGVKLSFEEICELEKNGDNLAKQIISKAKKVIAVSVSNLLGTVDPEVVILSGAFFEYNQSYYQDIVQIVKDITYGNEYRKMKFCYREKESDINSIGAALLICKSRFYE